MRCSDSHEAESVGSDTRRNVDNIGSSVSLVIDSQSHLLRSNSNHPLLVSQVSQCARIS